MSEELWLLGWLALWSAFYTWRIMAEPWVDPSEKAMTLFLSWLTPQQRKDYLRYSYFHVVGNHTGMTYRINKAVAPFNVEQFFGAKTVRRLCFVPYGANFTGDIMLAQKIGLETNEQHVLKIANDYASWTGRYFPQQTLDGGV